MTDFNNPAFRRQQAQANATRPPMREFNVGIEQDEMQPQQSTAEIESQVKVARQEKAEILKYGPRITDSAKRRIELLANIGRLTKDVKVGDHVFTLRTLKTFEQKEATMTAVANSNNDFELGFESRKQQLIRSICKVDGVDIADVLGTDDPAVKLEMLEAFEELVVVRLWDELTALKQEVNNKYGMNTTKAAEEVVADLKK